MASTELTKATSQSAESRKRLTASERKSLAGLVVIALSSVLVGGWAAWKEPSHDTLRYELAKTAMQVFAVAVLGSVAAMATFMFQHGRTQEDLLREKELERRRQRVEDDRDKRDRQDDLLRSLLDETLTSYNRVKRIRRRLVAETADDAGGHVRLNEYDNHMISLIDHQLDFEQLKRRSPFIDDERLVRSSSRVTAYGALAPTLQGISLPTRYENIEKYLNQVIGEYEKMRHVVAAEGEGVPLSAFTALGLFISKTGFESGAAGQIDAIIALLQGALLEPPPSRDPDSDLEPRE